MSMTDGKLLRTVAALAVCIVMASAIERPAHAIAVFDGANYSQNLLQAVRALQQINKQIQALANQAQMLLYQARNLDRLSFSAGPNLLASLGQIQGLMHRANGIVYRVSDIDAAYQRLYPEQYSAAATNDETVRHAQEAWRLARGGYKHALEVQAGVVAEVEADAAVLDTLVATSQAAGGNLQAIQAGNQLAAFKAKQSMQLQSLLAAQARAQALDRARALASQEQGRARLTRFLGDGAAYTP